MVKTKKEQKTEIHNHKEIHNHNYPYDWSQNIVNILIKSLCIFLLFILFINLISAVSMNINYKHTQETNTKYMYNECVKACETNEFPTDYKCINTCNNMILIRGGIKNGKVFSS